MKKIILLITILLFSASVFALTNQVDLNNYKNKFNQKEMDLLTEQDINTLIKVDDTNRKDIYKVEYFKDSFSITYKFKTIRKTTDKKYAMTSVKVRTVFQYNDFKKCYKYTKTKEYNACLLNIILPKLDKEINQFRKYEIKTILTYQTKYNNKIKKHEITNLPKVI